MYVVIKSFLLYFFAFVKMYLVLFNKLRISGGKEVLLLIQKVEQKGLVKQVSIKTALHGHSQ